MAKEPLSTQPNVVPFSDTMSGDNFQVEILEDDEITSTYYHHLNLFDIMIR